MADWLNLLIELLLIRSFRVSCPQDDNFFCGQLIHILSDARRRLDPAPLAVLGLSILLQSRRLTAT